MIGGVKLRRNLRPGPESSVALPRWALVAADDEAMATATKTSTSQTVSQARGDPCRDAIQAATMAVSPMATPPQPGTAVNSAARSMVSRMYRRWSAARASMGVGGRLEEWSGEEAMTKEKIGHCEDSVKYFVIQSTHPDQ